MSGRKPPSYCYIAMDRRQGNASGKISQLFFTMAIKKAHLPARQGFTLLELLMFVSLVGLILVGITQVLGSTLAGSGKSQGMQQVKQNGQLAMSTISRLLRQANNVDPLTCANSNQLNFTVLENGSTSTYRFETNSSRIRKTYNGVQSWLTDDPDPLQNGVQVTNFGCNLTLPVDGQPAIVNLSFNIGKPGLSVESIIANINFRDSVSLRNY